MATQTPCQTPGTHFATQIRSSSINVYLTGESLAERLQGLTEAQAEILEANIHNALELVLARYFQ